MEIPLSTNYKNQTSFSSKDPSFIDHFMSQKETQNKNGDLSK